MAGTVAIPQWAKLVFTSVAVTGAAILGFYQWLESRFATHAAHEALAHDVADLEVACNELETLRHRILELESIESQRQRPFELHVRVDSTCHGWQETGIDVEAGDVLEFYATGQVVYLSGKGLEDRWSGPRGIPTARSDEARLVSGFNFMTLMGRIGSTPFEIGESKSVDVKAGGRLSVAVNETDSQEGRRDNRGALDLYITRRRATRER